MLKTCLVSLILSFSLVLGSCGISQIGTDQTAQLPSSGTETTSLGGTPENPLESNGTPESTAMTTNPSVEKFVALSKNDLASRLGLDADKITLVKSVEKLWLNAALGCPRPGVFYSSGRVPGFQIWLEFEGIEYIYNTDFNGTLILCPELNPHIPNGDQDPTPGVPIP